ncbi:MAG: DUF2769 domain-containing protein [Thermoleophilia bacterium]|nr:DUF2769 domain-containing protein [Thermoleophilia bacterium]
MEVPDTPENTESCICGGCPTYIVGDKLLYCSVGKSDLELEQKGCICTDCALWPEYDLSKEYYCTEGKAE